MFGEGFGRGMHLGYGGAHHGMRGHTGRGFRAGFGLKYFILAILREGKATGADISRRIEEMSNYYWRPSPGSLYFMLRELSDNSFVEVEEEEGKKYYKITEAGKEIIENAWFPFRSIINKDLAQRLEEINEEIKARKSELSKDKLERLKKAAEEIMKELG